LFGYLKKIYYPQNKAYDGGGGGAGAFSLALTSTEVRKAGNFIAICCIVIFCVLKALICQM
jgi:hypothetical protein